MNDSLRTALKQLRLSGLLESLEVRLQEAAGHGLSHVEFLELILQDELAVRADRQAPVRVTVVRDASVGAVLDDGGLQGCEMGRAAAFVDVLSVWRNVDEGRSNSQGPKQFRRLGGCGAVGAIHQHSQLA